MGTPRPECAYFYGNTNLLELMVFKLSLNPPLSTHGALKDKDQMQGKRDFLGCFVFLNNDLLIFGGNNTNGNKSAQPNTNKKKRKKKTNKYRYKRTCLGQIQCYTFTVKGKDKKRGNMDINYYV